MNKNQAEGTVNKVAGRIQDAAAALTDDADQQVKGKARTAAAYLFAFPATVNRTRIHRYFLGPAHQTAPRAELLVALRTDQHRQLNR